MKFLTQRHAAVSGVGLIAVGVGLILVPGTDAARQTVATASVHPADGTAPTTASMAFAATDAAPSQSSNSAPGRTPSKPSQSSLSSSSSSSSPQPPAPTGGSSANSPAPAPDPSHASPTGAMMSSRPTQKSPTPPRPVSPATPNPPVQPPPSSPAPTRIPGMLTNVGSGLSVGVVQGHTADGSSTVTWHTETSLTDQHWTVVNTSYQGTGGLLFETNLTTSSVLDLDMSDRHVNLWHSLTGTNQLWWLAGSTISNGFYIHNVMASDCLTDNGLGWELTVEPCVTGNKAQIWFLP